MSLRSAMGLDASVTYSFLARSVSIVGSAGTVLLIVRVLNPIEQGYYYTLLSLVALQVVFEMGMSVVVQQLAAHECVHLRLNMDGTTNGNIEAHARLASVLQLSLRWYTIAAAIMGLFLAPLGMAFFEMHSAGNQGSIAWRGPWLMGVIASMAGLWCAPLYSFLEGCGQVREVAAMRLWQAVAATAMAWTAMALHHGLYSPALVILGQVGAGLIFLSARRRFFFELLQHSIGDHRIRWRTEVWPFQWRIAVSWVSSYLTVQIFIPILFAIRGAVESGQMGMTLSITGYMTILALSWTSTKATPFGRMIASRQFHALDRLFRRTLGQSLAAYAVVALFACGGMYSLRAVAPGLADRLLPPHLFVALILGAGANCAVQCVGTLLRSFKHEPFLYQSLVVAVIALVLAALTAPRWGNAGASLSYLVATGGVALPSALTILVRARRRYLKPGILQAFSGEAA